MRVRWDAVDLPEGAGSSGSKPTFETKRAGQTGRRRPSGVFLIRSSIWERDDGS